LSIAIPGTIAGIIGIALLLVDRFVFGIAGMKAATSILLLIVG